MSEPVISQRSPFVLKMESGEYWWCSCGRAKTQPFCDSSHAGTGLFPMRVELTEGRQVAWCGCKHTANAPFCDGSHRSLP